MIEWNKIKNGLDNLFGVSDEKSEPKENYLTTLYENLELQRLEYNTVPFKIIDLKEQGFTIKVGGLYGYISFYHMPWKYNNVDFWKNVFPFIKNKIFFAKIFELNRFENSIAIKLNGKIPQFKSANLQYDEQYQGIINKVEYGIFVDIGYHFNWECGSIVGMIHKSYFEDIIFEELEAKKIINVYYWGINDNEQLIIGTDKKFKEWMTNGLEELIGDKVNVLVKIIDEDNREYIVENTYQGLLHVKKSIYPGMNRTLIKSAIKNFKDKEIIQCEIIGINRSERTLNLKWISNTEIENVISRALLTTLTKNQSTLLLQQNNSIENMLKPEIVDKLNLVGRIVNVEVFRINKNSNKYLIEGKYKGKLSITNDNYRISVAEKKIIEQNLQDGDIINCEVLSVEKNRIRIKWKISDDELSRFINLIDT